MRRLILDLVALTPLWLALALCACGGAVHRGEPPDNDTPWCVRWSYVANGERLRVAQACVETERVCVEVVSLLDRFGRLGDVQQVGECERW